MVARHSRILDRALTRLKLRQLRLLAAVGRHGNIQNAAREMGVSQPAATKMIKDLELDFEVILFERTNRGVIPTVFGDALIRHGKLILAQVSNAAQDLDDLSEGNAGRVVVGTLLAASPNLLPTAIDRLLARRPKVAIKIVEGTNEVLTPALLSGEIDMIVGRLPSRVQQAGIVRERLLDETILAVCGPQHPLAGQAVSHFATLQPFGWVLPPAETTLRRQADQYFVRQGGWGYTPQIVIDSVSYLANRALLRRQDLIGLMPAHVAALDIERGILARIRWPVPFGSGPVGASHRGEDSLSPAARTFLDALREAGATV